MLTVIAEIRTRPGQHHRQAVLDQFAKIVPTVLKEEGCHGYAPMVDCAAGVSFQSMAPDCNQVNHLIPTRVLVKGGEITCKILK
ncbi:putative quinol monooxygenase [Escherichia coli]|nr:antibiotic biosynthesis monooxygenase [Escherichia coli]